ncbi:GGT1_5 [Mytilus coruscus]|uniref:GGT1_5 n=1 Tax=Mytilus coruscus TaxID=42192 RepID=A0A6J8C309_MYTCO|nr:GGT1_5 [Mytilus coruscus]
MDDFSTPNTVNSFGIPASPANFIKPRKRPLSSMCPSVVVNSDGMVNIVVGAAGGSKITTSSALVTASTQWLGMGIKEAIDHRRIHHQLLPAQIDVERGFPQIILDGLMGLGHNITLKDSAGSIVQGILQQQEGVVTANSDFRKHGLPDGY